MLKTSMIKTALLLLNIVTLGVSSVGTVYAFDGPHSYKSQSSKYSPNNRHIQYAQKQYRSRNDVMSEVKQRYNAKVLKMTLDEKTGIYNVRVLMPNGKVRGLKVNARG